MRTFTEFKTVLITALATLVVGIGGWVFAAQANAIAELDRKLDEHTVLITELKVLQQQQREINQELKEIVRQLGAR